MYLSSRLCNERVAGIVGKLIRLVRDSDSPSIGYAHNYMLQSMWGEMGGHSM